MEESFILQKKQITLTCRNTIVEKHMPQKKKSFYVKVGLTCTRDIDSTKQANRDINLVGTRGISSLPAYSEEG